MDHVHDVPLTALGRVNRRQRHVVLVQMRWPGQVRGRHRRVEREIGDEALAVRVPGRELLELLQVTQPRLGLVVPAARRFVAMLVEPKTQPHNRG